ncbi:BACON domain-containing protein [Thermogemmatispora onikobensis]|uniref:BACON domain-containing protein n=1 Tax=Thermogemmatispora onikobensis TaxID=732234 RepID=UPI000A68DA1D|nr:choice-of-anchor D domain-containing protein [Thermogemmatispora onikobensis]
MQTKRCRFCHKPVPAYAQVCRHCGRSLAPSSVPKRRERPRRRSIPPASPQPIGYHAGLHPEDQPYLSSPFSVPPSAIWEEPGPQPLASSSTSSDEAEPQPMRLQSQQVLPSPARMQRGGSHRAYEIVSSGPSLHRRHLLLRVLLVLFLVVLAMSAALTYLFFTRRWSVATLTPSLTVIPRQLHFNESLTLVGKGFGAGDLLALQRDGTIPLRDARGQPLRVQANAIGAFALQVTVTQDWQPGEHQLLVVDETQLLSIATTITVLPSTATPPQLRLSDYSVDLGADLPGTTTQLAITLLNAGGGQLNWRASSDRSWLQVDPASGSVVGSEVVKLVAQRGKLTAGSYTAHVTFVQQAGEQGKNAQVLTVTMTVLGSSATLSIAPASLSYTASSGAQAPLAQTVALQNHSQQALDWSSHVSTKAGGVWLQVTPSAGHLEAGTSITLSVTVSPASLAVGDYQGTVFFESRRGLGDEPQLTVNLHVVAPGQLALTPSALSFTTTQGQNPAPQSLTLQNSGGLTLSWSLTSSTGNNGEQWLGATPTAGTLAPGVRATVSVQVNAAGLAPGSYQGRLIFSAGSLRQEIPVALTVQAPALPTITVEPTILIFDVPHGTTPKAQTVTITNGGKAPLNWTITVDKSNPPLQITPAGGGPLAPGQNTTVSIVPLLSQVPANTSLSLTLTVAERDPELASLVPPQQVLVLIAVI